MAQMTRELISGSVMNVETILSEAEQKFPVHKGVIVDLTNKWADWRNCVCGTEEVTGSKGCTGVR